MFHRRKNNVEGLDEYRAMPLRELKELYENFLVPVPRDARDKGHWPQGYISNPDLPLIKQALQERGCLEE